MTLLDGQPSQEGAAGSQEDLQEVLRNLACTVGKLQQERTSSRFSAQAAERRNAELQARITILEQQAKRRDQEMGEMRLSEHASSVRCQELEQRLLDATSATAQLEQQHNVLARQVEELQADKAAMFEEVAALLQEAAAATDTYHADVQALYQELAQEQARRQQLETECAQGQATAAELAQKQQSYKEQLRKAREARAVMKNAYQRMRREFQQATRVLAPTSDCLAAAEECAALLAEQGSGRAEGGGRPSSESTQTSLPAAGGGQVQPRRLDAVEAAAAAVKEEPGLAVATGAVPYQDETQCDRPVNGGADGVATQADAVIRFPPLGQAAAPRPPPAAPRQLEQAAASGAPTAVAEAADSRWPPPIKRTRQPGSERKSRGHGIKPPSSPAWRKRVRADDFNADIQLLALPPPAKRVQAQQGGGPALPRGGADAAPAARAPPSGATGQGGVGYKYQEVVRRKDERQQLPAFECHECEQFYNALEGWGTVLPGGGGVPSCGHGVPAGMLTRAQAVDAASRHRYNYEPPPTPEGFWDMRLTPEEQDPPADNGG